jgi:hypothetical protein
MSTKTKRVLVTQAKDETLDSFKKMIREIFTNLTGKSGDDGSISDEKWIELHKKFLSGGKNG